MFFCYAQNYKKRWNSQKNSLSLCEIDRVAIMEKYFNTAGPNQPDSQYTLNPLKRIDLAEIELLFEQKKYFVLHAPRQTGKTSMLLALRDYLNAGGKYFCVYANINSIVDCDKVINEICTQFANGVDKFIDSPKYADEFEKKYLRATKSCWLTCFIEDVCRDFENPIVFLLNGIDNLEGDTFLSVIKQLRVGFNERPRRFPQTLIITGEEELNYYNQYGKLFYEKMQLDM